MFIKMSNVNLKNIKMFIEPLQTLYSKAEVTGIAKKLINND